MRKVAPGDATQPDTRVRSSWISRIGEPEEAAQVLARRSIEVATRSSGDTMAEAALELMRVANHDPAVLEHALVVCRSLARDDPTNEHVKRAIRLLKQVTTFLGVPPHLFETRSGKARGGRTAVGSSLGNALLSAQ